MSKKTTACRPAKDDPLSEEDAKLLEDCEEELRHEFDNIPRVGAALATIRDGRLYRGKGYPTFQSYCRLAWEIPPRTAYLKIKVSKIYEYFEYMAGIDGIASDELPANEGQLRALFVYQTLELQWGAWKIVLNEKARIFAELARARQNEDPPRKPVSFVMTAEFVKQVVDIARLEQAEEFHHYLTPDATFPLIPWRLDLFTASSPAQPSQQRFDLERLYDLRRKLPSGDLPKERPLVRVSPGYDLLDSSPTSAVLATLLQLLARIPDYRFLFWTCYSNRIESSFRFWPDNVEVAVCVRQQNDIAAFQEYWNEQSDTPACALWIIPTTPITIPSIAFTRLLIGEPGRQEPHNQKLIRKLCKNALLTQLPVHLSTDVRNALGQ